MLLGASGQSDHMGLHGDETALVQDFPVIVQLPSVHPVGRRKHQNYPLCWRSSH